MFSTWRAIGEKQGGTSPPFLRSSFSDSPLSSPSFCHRHHFVITIIVIAITVIAITVITTLTTLVLCRARVRDSGVREGFPVWLSREEALLSTGVLNLLSIDFSHSLANLIYQTDNLDTTWSSQICSESKISSLALTWQGYHSADSKWNYYEDSSWLALTEQAGRPGDIVLVLLLGGMCAWELYGACIVDWTDGSFPQLILVPTATSGGSILFQAG